MTAVEVAGPARRAELAALWELVFGDSKDYIDCFFSRRWPDGETLVLNEDGRVAAMLTLLPLTLWAGARRYEARYVYGVATHPDHRSKGHSGRLMQAVHERLTAQEIALSLLVPAEPGLFGFYDRLGYRTEFYLNEQELTLTPGREAPTLRNSSLAALAALRDARFGTSALYARWDERALAYQDAEAVLTGAETLCPGGDRPDSYAFCQPLPDGRVLIKELAASPGEEPALLQAVANYYNRSRLLLRRPAGPKTGRPFAMTRWYRPKGRDEQGSPPYFSLVLD